MVIAGHQIVSIEIAQGLTVLEDRGLGSKYLEGTYFGIKRGGNPVEGDIVPY